jgi:hypothetical protein
MLPLARRERAGVRVLTLLETYQAVEHDGRSAGAGLHAAA